MAQQFDIVGSLFGFSPEAVQQQITAEQQKRAMDIAGGVTGGLGPAVFQAARAQEAARGTPLFEMQQDPRLIKARAMSNARQAAAPAFQQGGIVGYLNEYANQLETAGLASEAAQARMFAEQKQQQAAESATKVFSQQATGTAALVRATADKRVPLADRLVELDAKKATIGLSPAEENERTALERVVKLQAPKEPPGAAALETEEAKKVGAGAGEQFTKVTTTDLDAASKRMDSIRELQVLAGQVDTGAFAEVKAKAQSLFKDLGINIGDPTDAQKLRAAIERGVAQSQLEQKGVQTDRDAARYRTASVLLTNTPAANQYIVDYQMALTERAREKARFFEDFRKKNKTSVGAEGAWQDSIRDKDIFDTPTLSKYKDTFKMNDLAKRVKEGKATDAEKKELAALMRQYGVTQVKVQ